VLHKLHEHYENRYKEWQVKQAQWRQRMELNEEDAGNEPSPPPRFLMYDVKDLLRNTVYRGNLVEQYITKARNKYRLNMKTENKFKKTFEYTASTRAKV